MQIESMRVISRRSWRVDEVSGADAWARLWRLEKFDEMRADAPGVLVQMDHMRVSFPGASVKSFTAVCPTTTAHTAAKNKTSAPPWRIINTSKRSPDCLKCIEPVQPLDIASGICDILFAIITKVRLVCFPQLPAFLWEPARTLTEINR